MKLPTKILYRYKKYCAPGDRAVLTLNWEPGSLQGCVRLFARKGGEGWQPWKQLLLVPAMQLQQTLSEAWRGALASYVERENYSGKLALEVCAVAQDETFPYCKVCFELDLPDVMMNTTTILNGETHGEGQGSIVFGSRFNGVTINAVPENPWQKDAFNAGPAWQPALTPIFRLSSDCPSGGGLSGSTALLRRGSETALIGCRSWRQVERGFFLLEPPGGSATNHWQGRGPILTGSQPHEGLAIAMTRELAVGRLHVHDDPNGAHWPLGWRIEEVAPGVTTDRLNREMDCRLDGRDPAVRARANRICDLGRLDMSRWHSTLTWDPERGLQGAIRSKGGTACSVAPLGGDPLSGPWEMSLLWKEGRYRAALQIHRESIPGDYSLDWFWATQSKPEGAPQLENRTFVWFPWEWRYELSQKQLEGVDRSAFWGRIGQTPFLWALQEDGSLAFYDEDELPKEIPHGESHG